MINKLMNLSSKSGWGSKIKPEVLGDILKILSNKKNDNLIVGHDSSDDAAIYKLQDDLALVYTLDFFTPIANDPYIYGKVAAANSISDVYAMGGKPLLALNIACFPEDFSNDTMANILKGANDAASLADVLIVGGHTVIDKEPKFGLSVIGLIHPDKVVKNNTVKLNDNLILTKPIGTGILSTALKAEILSKDTEKKLNDNLIQINSVGYDLNHNTCINAMTDITGFGLLGHISEMVKGTGYAASINYSDIKILPNVEDFAKEGILPEGVYHNAKNVNVSFSQDIKEYMKDIVFDPQTNGGLLISVNDNNLESVLQILDNTNHDYCNIGKIIEKSNKDIEMRL